MSPLKSTAWDHLGPQLPPRWERTEGSLASSLSPQSSYFSGQAPPLRTSVHKPCWRRTVGISKMGVWGRLYILSRQLCKGMYLLSSELICALGSGVCQGHVQTQSTLFLPRQVSWQGAALREHMLRRSLCLQRSRHQWACPRPLTEQDPAGPTSSVKTQREYSGSLTESC